MKKIIYVFSINLGLFLALLLSLEMVSRIMIPQQNITPIFSDQNLRTRGRPFVEPHETRGFALKPGFSNGLYSINKKGFRGEEIESLNKKNVILTLGESTTFGWGVKDNETYPAYLMDFFPKNDNIYVINGGVPSYTSSQVLMSLQGILTNNEVQPELILICILWNDIWYSTITNWHPDILIYQKQPEWLTLLTKYSRFGYGCVMGFSKHEKQTNVFNENALVQYEKNIEKMIQKCRQNKIRLAFVEPPFDADHMLEGGLNEFHVRYTKDFFIEMAEKYITRLHTIAEKYKVPVIAHRLDIKNLHQKSLFLDTLHPTAQGNSMIAQDMYNQVMDKNILIFKK